MVVHLSPETEAQLAKTASSLGLSPDEYVETIVKRELAGFPHSEAAFDCSGGMIVDESGLRVYRTNQPVPEEMVDDAVRGLRADRARRILGNHQ